MVMSLPQALRLGRGVPLEQPFSNTHRKEVDIGAPFFEEDRELSGFNQEEDILLGVATGFGVFTDGLD